MRVSRAMRVRISGFGFVLSTAAVLSPACARHVAAPQTTSAKQVPGLPGSLAAPPPTPEPPPSDVSVPSEVGVVDAAPTAAPPPPSEMAIAPDANGGNRATAASAVTRREMLDIEATVSLRVTKLKSAVNSLHELASRVGGVVTSERVDWSSSLYGAAQLTLRVPSGSTPGVLQSLDALGTVTNQTVSARDIGKEYFDASLRLSNLENTLRRYQEILSQATKVDEILRIEQELGRVRAEIEQMKGNLRWLSDRAARATLHVNLSAESPELVRSEEPDPEPKFFPGLRGVGLVDFDESDERAYAGGGLSIRASRSLSLDLDLLKRFDSDARGPDALLVTFGGELFSDRLGDGRRRFLNPYLGWRAGYAHFDANHQALGGVTLGLELVKTHSFVLDLEARNYLIAGGDRGLHYALTPALAAAVAF